MGLLWELNEIIHVKESKHSSCCYLPEFWSGFPLKGPCMAVACRGQHPRSNQALLRANVLGPFKFRAGKSKVYKAQQTDQMTECMRVMRWRGRRGRIKKIRIFIGGQVQWDRMEKKTQNLNKKPMKNFRWACRTTHVLSLGLSWGSSGVWWPVPSLFVQFVPGDQDTLWKHLESNWKVNDPELTTLRMEHLWT